MEGKSEHTTRRKSATAGLKSVLGGSILASEKVTRQLPFIFYIVFLSLCLIWNRNVSEKKIRRLEAVQESLKELRAESITHETRLMYINRPSEVARRVQQKGLDLQEPREPAIRIKVKKK